MGRACMRCVCAECMCYMLYDGYDSGGMRFEINTHSTQTAMNAHCRIDEYTCSIVYLTRFIPHQVSLEYYLRGTWNLLNTQHKARTVKMQKRNAERNARAGVIDNSHHCGFCWNVTHVRAHCSWCGLCVSSNCRQLSTSR